VFGHGAFFVEMVGVAVEAGSTEVALAVPFVLVDDTVGGGVEVWVYGVGVVTGVCVVGGDGLSELGGTCVVEMREGTEFAFQWLSIWTEAIGGGIAVPIQMPTLAFSACSCDVAAFGIGIGVGIILGPWLEVAGI